MGIDIDIEENKTFNSEAGIIPRFCQELFLRIDKLRGKIHAEVEVSYFEIYNEKIHDLLAISGNNTLTSIQTTSKPALRVREHPIWGPYCCDLSTHPVDSHSAIKNWLAIGNSQRATATTKMNEKSSRSHSIFNIILNLTEIQSDQTFDAGQSKRSKISLVDLAGSERVHTSQTYASGERLREGVGISINRLN